LIERGAWVALHGGVCRSHSRWIFLFLLLPIAIASADGALTYDDALRSGREAFPNESFMVVWVTNQHGYTFPYKAGFVLPEDLTPISWALGKLISSADKRPVSLVIAGPESSQARNALVTATQLVHHMLPHLRILFIGDVQDGNIARYAIEKVGGKIVASSSS